MIQARFELDDYTARVLDVIKGRFGLKNREEALKRLALEHGEEYVEPKPNESILRELDAMYESHKKEHADRKMDDKELRKLLKIGDDEKI